MPEFGLIANLEMLLFRNDQFNTPVDKTHRIAAMRG